MANGILRVKVIGDTSQFSRSLAGAGTSLDRFASAGKLAAVAITAAMVGIGTASVKAASSFEAEMSRVAANANGTAEQMARLQQVVLQLGKDTVFSAGQAAQAANELVKAGMSLDDTMAALPGMLGLAAAGELGVAEAAEITANQLSVFNLKARDAERVADVLALTANRSTTEVSLLGDSLAMAGAVASQAGMSLEETAAALGLLANNGIKGSDAGTSLKQMLLALMGPSEKAAELMASIGFNAYDASGRMKSMEEIVAGLAQATQGMTDQERDFALATIFGSDAVRAANILLKEGATNYRNMTTELSKSGAAAEIAATKMDNLKGSWEQFMGSLETAGIMMGNTGIPGLREVVDGLTEATNEFIDVWSRLTNSDAWKGGGFEVKFDLAAKTIEGFLLDLVEQGAEKLKDIDWGALGGTVVNAIGDAVAKMGPVVIEVAVDMAKDAVTDEGFVTGVMKYGNALSMIVQMAKSFGEGLEANAVYLNGTWIPVVEDAAGATTTWADVLMLLGDDQQLVNDKIFEAEVAQLKHISATEALTQRLREHAVAVEEDARKEEELTQWTDLLGSAFGNMVSPATAWTDAINASAEAAGVAADQYKAGQDTLASFLEEMQKQIENWENYEANLERLARQWGPEFGADIIAEAAKIGPDFVAALVGSDDPALVQSSLSALAELISEDQTGLAEKILGWAQQVGTRAGQGMATAWGRAFAAYYQSPSIPANPYATHNPYEDWSPSYAEGTITRGPQLALIGEAGPELVLPLTNRRRSLELLAQSGLLRRMADGGLVDYPVGYEETMYPIGYEEIPRRLGRALRNSRERVNYPEPDNAVAPDVTVDPSTITYQVPGFTDEQIALIVEMLGMDALVATGGNTELIGNLLGTARRMKASGASGAAAGAESATVGDVLPTFDEAAVEQMSFSTDLLQRIVETLENIAGDVEQVVATVQRATARGLGSSTADIDLVRGLQAAGVS